ncbi:MAG: transglycosylase domain-containing protein, partial [Chloroflexota bacterium]
MLRIVLTIALVLPLAMAASGGAVAAGGYTYFSRDLPSVDLVFDRPLPQSTLIYDRNGNLLMEVNDPNYGRRVLTPLHELGNNLIAATLAAEDPNFYTTPGVDPTAVARAVVMNFQSGGIVSGASTLSMQLIRNALFDTEQRYAQSYDRKIKEAILAFNLAQRYSKDQILEMYLNEVYYGNFSNGAEAASWSYFGKPAKDLNLAEAALLAGLPQAPTDYNPYLNPELAARRQSYVLGQMVKYGFISQEEADEAAATPIYLDFVSSRFTEAPHFALYVLDMLVQRYGYEKVYYGGLRVTTSIDLDKQKIATEKAREHIATLKASNAGNAALVSIDPRTGEVLAMVGSVNFEDDSIDGQVNMAVAERQPGSSIKPFTYVTAFEKLGYVPATLINDAPMSFPQKPGLPPYRPMNWNFQFNGVVPLRVALAASMNIPAVQVVASVGVPSMIATAHKMGITTINRPPDQYGLAITLGAAEVRLLDEVFAYSVFANNGKMIGAKLPEDLQKPGYAPYEPVIIKKVTDYRGDVLYEHTPQPPIQVIPAEYAYLITAALSDDESRVLTYG